MTEPGSMVYLPLSPLVLDTFDGCLTARKSGPSLSEQYKYRSKLATQRPPQDAVHNSLNQQQQWNLPLSRLLLFSLALLPRLLRPPRSVVRVSLLVQNHVNGLFSSSSCMAASCEVGWSPREASRLLVWVSIVQLEHYWPIHSHNSFFLDYPPTEVGEALEKRRGPSGNSTSW
jgi:hypothetical protein